MPGQRINWIAWTLAILIALGLPAVYFALSHQHLAGSLEAEAGIKAHIISQVINQNPELWRFEEVRLHELLSRGLEGVPSSGRYRIFDGENRLVAQNSVDPGWPALTRTAKLFDSGKVVGWIGLSQSLRPLLAKMGALALLGVMLGAAVFVTLQVLPLRALRRAWHSLSESQALLQAILDTATDAIISADGKEQVLLFNKQAEGIFGYSSREIIGRPLLVLLPDPGVQSHNGRMEGLEAEYISRRQMGKRLERVGLRKGGEEFPVELSVARLAMEGMLIFTVFVRDITEEKRAQEALQRTQAQLFRSEKLVALGTLLSGVAHEVLNPVNILFVKIQMLKQGIGTENPDELRDNLDAMEEQIKRVTRITQNLLNFSRPQEPRLESLDVRKTLDSVVALVEYQYRLSNVKVTRDYEAALPSIYADPDQMSQVFLNFLTNARDAMPQGGQITLRARSFMRAGELWVRIAVEDNGTGIPRAILHRIFDPFFTTKPAGKGTGLGLSIAHGIVENHGGRIDVSTVEGAGTTFVVELPAGRRGERENGGDSPGNDPGL